MLEQADKPSGLGGEEQGIKPDHSGLTASWRFEPSSYSNRK
ncbi:MAG: hypothetical protein OEY51_12690 [Cyclobacteriaceae bacterium]|nr:hypothetical protein [Cyclobacteriaceae bacterium]